MLMKIVFAGKRFYIMFIVFLIRFNENLPVFAPEKLDNCLNFPGMEEKRSTSNDEHIDCILLNRVDKKSTISLRERKCIFSKSKIIAMAGNGVDPDSESDEDCDNDTDGFSVSNTADAPMRNFVPKEPMDIALMFCIMANLDARRRLPSPEEEAAFPFYAGERV